MRFSALNSAYKTLCRKEREKRLLKFPAGDRERTGAGEAEDTDIYSYGQLLVSGRSADMRAFAARRLGNSGKRSAYPFLRKGLNDENEVVVESCIKAIGTIKIYQSAGDLSAVFSRGSVKIKLCVLETVKNIGFTGGFRNIIVLAMQDPEPEAFQEHWPCSVFRRRIDENTLVTTYYRDAILLNQSRTSFFL